MVVIKSFSGSGVFMLIIVKIRLRMVKECHEGLEFPFVSRNRNNRYVKK